MSNSTGGGWCYNPQHNLSFKPDLTQSGNSDQKQTAFPISDVRSIQFCRRKFASVSTGCNRDKVIM